MTTDIELERFVAEESTQPRCKMDDNLTDRYVEAMNNGAEFPPVVGFSDDEKIILANGFHRLRAAQQAGLKRLACDIHPPVEGETPRRSAILYAVGANHDHGLQRCAADKRRAVRMLLSDPECRYLKSPDQRAQRGGLR